MPNKIFLLKISVLGGIKHMTFLKVLKKREILKPIARDHLNINKEKFLIEEEEGQLLNIFADEILAFYEEIEILFKSKSLISQKFINTLWTTC